MVPHNDGASGPAEANQRVFDGFHAFWKQLRLLMHLAQSYRTPAVRDATIQSSFLGMRAAAKQMQDAAPNSSPDLEPAIRFAHVVLDFIPTRVDLDVVNDIYRGALQRASVEANLACMAWKRRQRIAPDSKRSPPVWRADGKAFVPSVTKILKALPAASWEVVEAKTKLNGANIRSLSAPLQQEGLIQKVGDDWCATPSALVELAMQERDSTKP